MKAGGAMNNEELVTAHLNREELIKYLGNGVLYVMGSLRGFAKQSRRYDGIASSKTPRNDTTFSENLTALPVERGNKN
jgi:hypothetical protein